MDDVVLVFACSACNSAVIQPLITTSDSEVSSSDSLSERRDTNCSSDLDYTGGHFVFRRDFAPYQGEHLTQLFWVVSDQAGVEQLTVSFMRAALNGEVKIESISTISGSSFDKTTCSRGSNSARICSAGKIGGEVGFRAARRI